MLEACLSKDIRSGASGHILAGFAGDRDEPGFGGVLVLAVAAALARELPAVGFDQANDRAELHAGARSAVSDRSDVAGANAPASSVASSAWLLACR